MSRYATTPEQHLTAYEIWTAKAAKFADVARSLHTSGDPHLADQVQAYADGYTAKAGESLIAAADAWRDQNPVTEPAPAHGT